MSTDRDRFEALFRRNYAAVTSYAVRRVGVDAAGEVVSETFLTAWRRLEAVPQDALPWLYGTARRVIANELRRRRRHQLLDERVAAAAQLVVPDPSETVTERIRIRAAIDRLRPGDAEAIRLTEWEGLAAREAAQVMGCTATAFAVRLHRARRRLGALLEIDRAETSEAIQEEERHDRHVGSRK